MLAAAVPPLALRPPGGHRPRFKRCRLFCTSAGGTIIYSNLQCDASLAMQVSGGTFPAGSMCAGKKTVQL